MRLPVFHGEPAMSVVAVMLFPNDLLAAETHAARLLARGPIQKLDVPFPLSDEFLRVLGRDMATDKASQNLVAGVIAGEIVKTLWALINAAPTVASWGAAIEVVEGIASEHIVQNAKSVPIARSTYRKHLREFRPVLHLWGVFSLGQRRWPSDYTIFVAQAQALLDKLRTWAKGKRNESINLSGDFYHPPLELGPVQWPLEFTLPVPTLPEDFIPARKRPGRPRGNKPSDTA
jgi:hypothetical protein